MRVLNYSASVLVVLLCSLPETKAFTFDSRPHATHARRSSSALVVKSSGVDVTERLGSVMASIIVALALIASASPVLADGQTKSFKLPPIDFSDKTRCNFSGSKMGQANAARDKLYDLRQCNLSGKDASGFDLSGVIMTKTDVSNAKFVETQFSKSYLHDSNFDGADFTNGIIDRASFRGSSVRGSIFSNAVLTGTSFEGADVENADFTDAYIGDYDIRNLCKNPTLKGENPVTGVDTRASVGCERK